MTPNDSFPEDHLFQWNMHTSELLQTVEAKNINKNVKNTYNGENELMSVEELINLIDQSNDNRVSADKDVDILEDQLEKQSSSPSIFSSCTHPTAINEKNYRKEKRALNQSINHRKTLFVSGLRYNVNRSKIRRHFIGCIKVTIKQYRTTPYLKYAFVFHRTSQEAERNLKHPINYRLLGPQCRVDYANGYSLNFNNHQTFDKKIIVIRRIPENVNESDLHRLFINCHILNYCPARVIHSTLTTTNTTNTRKILWGYAFIVYNDEREAANVVNHAEQYHINGQPLTISFCHNKMLSCATTGTVSID